MTCHIQYDFIAQTRTLVDAAAPCAGGRSPVPDALRPNIEADSLMKRHLAMLSVLDAERSGAAAA